MGPWGLLHCSTSVCLKLFIIKRLKKKFFILEPLGMENKPEELKKKQLIVCSRYNSTENTRVQ